MGCALVKNNIEDSIVLRNSPFPKESEKESTIGVQNTVQIVIVNPIEVYVKPLEQGHHQVLENKVDVQMQESHQI